MAKWKRNKGSRAFVHSLRREYGGRVFGLKEAYGTYVRKHAKRSSTVGEGPLGSNWTQMSARNAISAAAYKRQGLRRVGKGRYYAKPLKGGGGGRGAYAKGHKFFGNQYVKVGSGRSKRRRPVGMAHQVVRHSTGLVHHIYSRGGFPRKSLLAVSRKLLGR